MRGFSSRLLEDPHAEASEDLLDMCFGLPVQGCVSKTSRPTGLGNQHLGGLAGYLVAEGSAF